MKKEDVRRFVRPGYARMENAKKEKYRNVEFRLGEIENLPAADESADVVISNCVINLAADKRRVFREAHRVLRPGGRLMISDMVLLKKLPNSVAKSIEAYVGCLAGAMKRKEYLAAIEAAGFQNVEVLNESTFPLECMANDPTAQAIVENLKIPADELKKVMDSVASVQVRGEKA